MSDISPSKLGEEFDAQFEAKINAAQTPEQLKSLLHDRELAQGLRVADAFDETLLHLVDTPQPREYAKTVRVNGQKHILSAASETELAQAEVALYHSLFAQPAFAGPEQPRDSATGQFRATAEQERATGAEAARVDGMTQIETDLVNRVLAEQGIDPAALRDLTAAREQKSWADATQEFLTGPGASWPGGDPNRNLLGTYLVENNLTNAQDKVAALDAAYKHLVKTNQLQANPETVQAQKIAEARTPEELRDAIGYRTALWGR
jgi:hypothetical protein